MKKLFTAIFFVLIVLGILFGFVLPSLISAKDDLAVISGFGIMFALIYFSGIFAIKVWNKMKKVKEGSK